MLICNEGPPRAGKSYDCVKTHIVPAVKAGRKVYARLNGLDHEKIAEFCDITVERCRDLLIVVGPEEVNALFVAEGDDPPRFKVDADALIVIDEVHEFYVSGRQALPKQQEAFFAKHGHIGLDIIVMTQALGRLHSSIRQRIERKTMFAKLNALGNEDKYVARFYSVGDTMGKFEKISSETHAYEAVYFPMYKGFQPEAKNTGAYKAGSKTVWQVIKLPAVAMVVVVVLGIAAVAHFFKGGALEKAGEAKPVKQVVATAKASEFTAPAASTVAQVAAPIQERIAVKPNRELPATVAYVVDLAASARPRLAGVMGDRALLEWRQGQGNAIERMTSDQLIAMGWGISIEPYGVVARYEAETILFTAWPIDLGFSQTSAKTDRIREAGASLPNASEEASRTAAASAPSHGAVIAAPPPLAGGDKS